MKRLQDLEALLLAIGATRMTLRLKFAQVEQADKFYMIQDFETANDYLGRMLVTLDELIKMAKESK